MSMWNKITSAVTDMVDDGRAVSDLQTFKITAYRGEILRPGTGMRKYAVANAQRVDAKGVRASVESAGSINRRITATRVGLGVATFGVAGLLAAAMPKKVDDRETILLVEGEEFVLALPFPADKLKRAHELAAEITTTGKVTK